MVRWTGRQSNRGGQGGQNAMAGQNQPAAPGGQPGANMQAQNGQRGGNRTPGQFGQGGQQGQGGNQNRQPGQGGGRGMGQNSDLANMTPEQRQALMDRYAAMRGAGAGGRGNQPGTGGRGGTGPGGRGANAQNGQNPRALRGMGNNGQGQPSKLQDGSNAGKTIDELWAEIIPHDNPGSVWKLEDKNCQDVKPCLNEYKIRLGVTDGNFTELKSGDLQVGDEVVASITLPVSMRPANSNNPNNPLLGGQQRGPGMGWGGRHGRRRQPRRRRRGRRGGGGGGGRGGN
jgi:hypothetical protein